MRVLVWQWGRRGGGPRYAVELAEAIGQMPGCEVLLSLSRQAELLAGAMPPDCDLPVETYTSGFGFLWRFLCQPLLIGRLARRIRRLAPDVAICAMPALLDGMMAAALRRLGVPFFVVVHDANAHPGDNFPFMMPLQQRLMRRADGLVTLSAHVAAQLRAKGLGQTAPIIVTPHPPRRFGPPPPAPMAHGGRLRLLNFGRLLPYKGLDLLAAALRRLGPAPALDVRIVGQGPESDEIAALRALPYVRVENRWVPEEEIGAVMAWADALVLSHREASQSGAASAAIAARRWVVATEVGGIAEQLADEPLARLCAPTEEGLAEAIRGLMTAPPVAAAPGADADARWAAGVANLVLQLRAATARRG